MPLLSVSLTTPFVSATTVVRRATDRPQHQARTRVDHVTLGGSARARAGNSKDQGEQNGELTMRVH